MLNYPSFHLAFAAILAGPVGILFILLIDPDNIDLCVEIITGCQIALFVAALIVKLAM